jgi:hypothetical protein
MTGTGKTRKREQAIAALLESPTITEAAQVVGVGEKTLRRWLAEPEFQAAYRDARQEAVRMAVGRLQGLLVKATETLERTMSCNSPAIELRAAVAVIEQGFKGAELLDLAERLAALESKVKTPWT